MQSSAQAAPRGIPVRAVVASAVAVGAMCLLVAGQRAVRSGSTIVPDDAAYRAEIDGYRPVSFDLLAGFDYADGTPIAQIPAAVRSLDGVKVAVYGFMLPLEGREQAVTRFLVNGSYDMCMFGAGTGSPNQWVDVRMPETSPADYTHLPVTVLGTLAVREQRRGGRLLSLYQLRADRVVARHR